MPPSEADSGLVIQLLGGFQVRNAVPCTVPLSPKLRDLLAILASRPGRQHSRDSLMGQLWRDAGEAEARQCLRSALWRLRRILEPAGVRAGTYLVAGEQGCVSFRADSDAFVDAVVFDSLAAPEDGGRDRREAGLSEAGWEKLRRAVGLYRGEFMPGCYEDWVVIERERHRERYIASTARLARFHAARGDYDQALDYCWAVLGEDPLRETVHRQVLAIYAACGRRAEAIAHYRWLARRLREELDVAPLPETRAFYQEALSGAEEAGPCAAAAGGEGGRADLQATIDKVQGIIRDAEAIKLNLERQVGRLSERAGS